MLFESGKTIKIGNDVGLIISNVSILEEVFGGDDVFRIFIKNKVKMFYYCRCYDAWGEIIKRKQTGQFHYSFLVMIYDGMGQFKKIRHREFGPALIITPDTSSEYINKYGITSSQITEYVIKKYRIGNQSYDQKEYNKKMEEIRSKW